MSKGSKKKLDAIDILIIELLRKDPRQSLREIKKELAQHKHKVSSETVRKRIEKLGKYLSFQPIPNLKALGYYNALLLISVKGTKQDRQRVIKKIHQLRCCFDTADTIGEYELVTFMAFEDIADIASIVDAIKEVPKVKDVRCLLVTSTHSPISGLLKKLNR